MIYSKRLKEARSKKGYTQGRLAELTGIHEKAIARYERGAGLPSLDNVVKLAQALEVTLDYFVFPHAKPDGVPIVKDPILYERYFVLESLNDEDRKSIINVLDSLIARQRFREAAGLI